MFSPLRTLLRAGAALLAAASCATPTLATDDLIIHQSRLPGGRTVHVTWEARPSAAEYRVLRADAPQDVEGEGTLLGRVVPPVFDDLLPPVGTHYYRVLIDCTDEDAYEPNDGPAEAWSPPPPEPPDFEDDRLFLCPGDEDWFRGAGLAGGRVRGELAYDPAELVPVLELLVGMPPRLVARSATGFGEEGIDIEAPEDGDYLFRVVGLDGRGGPYQARFAYPDVPCIDDAGPDDSADEAIPIVLPWTDTAQLCGLDVDWYSFEANNRDTVSAEVIVTPGSMAGPFTLALIDSDGVTVLAESPEGSVGRQVFGPTPSTYYLLVSNPDSFGEGSYRIDVTRF